MSKKNALSVVVLTHDSYTNKGGCIEHCILGLLHQMVSSDELIICSNNSPKASLENLKYFLSTLSSSVAIKLLEADTTVGSARNIGVDTASNPYILFVDEDCIVYERNTLEKVRVACSQYDFGCGATRLWTGEIDWFIDNSKAILSDITKKDFTQFISGLGSPPDSVRAGIGVKFLRKSFIANFGFVKRDVFWDVGGFPNRFKGYGCEDDALMFLLIAHTDKFFPLYGLNVSHVSHESNNLSTDLTINRVHLEKLINEKGYNEFHVSKMLYGFSKEIIHSEILVSV